MPANIEEKCTTSPKGRPRPSVRPVRWRLVFALLVIALLPRVFIALRQPCLCMDSVHYLARAESFANGDTTAAMAGLKVNTYPVVLAALSRLGDLELLARIWNVAMGTLVVLPLYGWVRRQFNERLGILACVLYAFSDFAAEQTPLIMRDPGFWLYITSTLYFTFRATTERMWRHFIFAGLFMALAIHTREEGWLLVLLPIGWSLGPLWRLPEARVKSLVGGLLLFSMIPLFLLLFNLTILRGHDRWEYGRFRQMGKAAALAKEWWETREPAPDSPTADAHQERNASPPSAESPPVSPTPDVTSAAPPIATTAPAERPDQPAVKTPPTVAKKPPVAESENGERKRIREGADLARKILGRIVYLFGVLQSLLLLIGLLSRRSLWRYPGQGTLLLIAALNFAACWLCAFTSPGCFDKRYLMILFFCGLPAMAHGLVVVSEWTRRLGLYGPRRSVRPSVALRITALMLVLVTGTAIALTPRPFRGEPLARMGQWLRDEQGDRRVVVSPLIWSDAMYLERYAERTIPRGGARAHFEALTDASSDTAPDIVLFWEYSVGGVWGMPMIDSEPGEYEPILCKLQEQGYRRVPRNELPPGCETFTILIRTPD